MLVGKMNPAIFQPEWFVRNGLLRSFGAEEEDKLELVSPTVTVFSTSAFRLLVEGERLSISCSGAESFELIRDLVLGAFRRLEHTPISSMGLNRDMHFRAPTRTGWDAFGDQLAPKEQWKTTLADPKMLTVQMSGKRHDGKGGRITVTVQPSTTIDPGVYVQVNDHYDQASASTLDTMMLLENEFLPSLNSGLAIGQKLTESIQ